MKKIIHSEKAPSPIGPFCFADTASPEIYTSGQIPIDPRTGVFVEGGIREQTIQVLHALVGLGSWYMWGCTIWLCQNLQQYRLWGTLVCRTRRFIRLTHVPEKRTAEMVAQALKRRAGSGLREMRWGADDMYQAELHYEDYTAAR